MADLLSPEWLDQLRADAQGTDAGDEGHDAGDPAATAVVQHVVNGAPDGTVSYWTRIDRGRVVEAALGEAEKPDLTFTVAYDDAVRLDRGDVEPSAAYMQGRLKADGDMTKLFALLAASHRAPA